MSGKVALKIYGERNTGTNYLAKLLEKNLKAEILPGQVGSADLRTVLTRQLHRLLPSLAGRVHEKARDRYFEVNFARNFGWKHMNPSPERIGPEALASVRFMMVVKNPYSWLLSLHRNPYHIGGRDALFEDFLDRRLPVMECRENIGPDPLTPVEVWNRKMRGYLTLKAAAKYAAIVRYEDFLADEFDGLRQVANLLDIPLRQEFVHVDEGVKRSDQGIFQSEYANYYLKELWREKLTESTLRKINAQLDQDIVVQMGYRLIAPSEAGLSAVSPAG